MDIDNNLKIEEANKPSTSGKKIVKKTITKLVKIKKKSLQNLTLSDKTFQELNATNDSKADEKVEGEEELSYFKAEDNIDDSYISNGTPRREDQIKFFNTEKHEKDEKEEKQGKLNNAISIVQEIKLSEDKLEGEGEMTIDETITYHEKDIIDKEIHYKVDLKDTDKPKEKITNKSLDELYKRVKTNKYVVKEAAKDETVIEIDLVVLEKEEIKVEKDLTKSVESSIINNEIISDLASDIQNSQNEHKQIIQIINTTIQTNTNKSLIRSPPDQIIPTDKKQNEIIVDQKTNNLINEPVIIPKDKNLSKVEKLENQQEEHGPSRLINKFASALVTVAGGIVLSIFLYRRFKS